MPSIEATSITIAKIKPPEGRARGDRKPPGYVLDTAGVYWNIWPDQYPMFAGKEGTTVVVNFKTDEYLGKPKYTILGIAGGNTGTPKAPPRVPAPAPRLDLLAQAQAMGVTPITPAQREENIVMQATLKVYQGQLQLGDRKALISAWRMIRSAWRELQAGGISLQEELNDELPSFEEPKSIEDTF